MCNSPKVRELNQKILISLSNETDFPHEGVLDFVDNEVRTTTGTLLVCAELNNANRFFAPGMFVTSPHPDRQPRRFSSGSRAGDSK
jgi:multidrug efflux pump subunit AcrA (membrane-fusion protein)